MPWESVLVNGNRIAREDSKRNPLDSRDFAKNRPVDQARSSTLAQSSPTVPANFGEEVADDDDLVAEDPIVRPGRDAVDLDPGEDGDLP